MRRIRRVRLAELRARLARLRASTAGLAGHAAIGRDLRRTLAAAGSPTWRPAEDLSWRSWIEREGDEEARGLLAALDELLAEMVAKGTAGGEGR